MERILHPIVDQKVIRAQTLPAAVRERTVSTRFEGVSAGLQEDNYNQRRIFVDRFLFPIQEGCWELLDEDGPFLAR